MTGQQKPQREQNQSKTQKGANPAGSRAERGSEVTLWGSQGSDPSCPRPTEATRSGGDRGIQPGQPKRKVTAESRGIPFYHLFSSDCRV